MENIKKRTRIMNQVDGHAPMQERINLYGKYIGNNQWETTTVFTNKWLRTKVTETWSYGGGWIVVPKEALHYDQLLVDKIKF